MVGERLGPYEVLERIGEGGMGVVYKARDTRLDRTVAIKFLAPALSVRPERRARFEREAQTIARLNHPNICTLHDVGQHQGSTFLVMEFLEGETLAERLSRGHLPLELALQYGAQIADALARAHRAQVVHRDLKPANIMLTPTGAKLLDFGVAKLKATDDQDGGETTTTRTSERTRDGGVVGTVSYMSPEQAQGLPIDHRSDIFSLGIVLFEMVTGTRPFSGPTAAAVEAAIIAHTPPPVSEVDPSLPPEVTRIIRRCLQKDPDDRYQSTADLRCDLADLREATTHNTGARRAPLPRPVRFTARLAAVGFSIVVAALLLAAWIVRPYWRSAATPNEGRGRRAAASSLVPVQLTAATGWESEPALSPDGSLVAYASDESGNVEIRVVSIGGGNSVNVSNDPATDEKPAWFPDGSALAFASDRGGQWNIWKVPPLGGGASLLVANGRAPALSPDTRQIAFVRADAAGNGRVMVARLDDLSNARFVSKSPDPAGNPEQDPAWSPDGTSLCYSSYRALWIAPMREGAPRRLTTEGEYDIEPAWSADGQSVYFSSFRGGVYSIWRIPAAGGTAERLTSGPGPERHPSLSRDGLRLAFSTFATNADIVLEDLATAEQRQVGSTRDEAFPSLSPDGTQLVYTALTGGDGGSELWRQGLSHGWPAGDPQRLTDQSGMISQPDFSPDGRWIVYQRAAEGRARIWIIPARGGEPVPFTDDRSDAFHPAWSPDGGRIAFVSSRTGEEHLFASPVQDGRPAGLAREMTRGTGNCERPAWSPDGKRVAYVTLEAATAGVWVMDADGTRAPERIVASPGVQYVRWHPRGGAVVAAAAWGEPSGQSLRLLNVDGRGVRPFRPEVRIPDGVPPTFSLRPDGRFLAFPRAAFSGDIWVRDMRAPTH